MAGKKNTAAVNISEIPIFKQLPNAKQELFLTESKARFVGYGGARSGGKTWAIWYKALSLSCEYGSSGGYPGIKILILRKQLSDLQQNHIVPLCRFSKGIARYKDQKKLLEFINGSTITFGYYAKDADAEQYQGQEYDVVFIDEATQLKESIFVTLDACIRGGNPKFPKRMYITCNPGGMGHEWVKRLFVTKQYKMNENPDDYVFIPAKAEDNTWLRENDPASIVRLKMIPDEALRNAWLNGDWDAFAGDFFKQWSNDVHVINPFPIPKHWKRYHVIDYGLDMLASLWVAIDEEGTMFVYRGIAEKGQIVPDACRIMRAAELGDDCQYTRYAPPDLWGREAGTGKSQIDLFAEHGFYFIKADNERIAGWLSVKEYLQVYVNESGEKKAKIYFFRGKCENLVECIPCMQHNAKKPNDCMTEPHEVTHSPDALRYLCIMRKLSAAPVGVPVEADARFMRQCIERKMNQGPMNKKIAKVWKGMLK